MNANKLVEPKHIHIMKSDGFDKVEFERIWDEWFS